MCVGDVIWWSFIIEKRMVLHFGYNNIKGEYEMGGDELEAVVDEESDLRCKKNS